MIRTTITSLGPLAEGEGSCRNSRREPVGLRLVVVAAQDQDHVGIAERRQEFIAVGDGIEAKVCSHDHRHCFGHFRQIVSKESEGLAGDRLGGVVSLLVVLQNRATKCTPPWSKV